MTASQIRHEFDALLSIRASGSAAPVAGATTNGAGIDIEKMTGYWANGENATHRDFAIHGAVDVIGLAGGNVQVETSVNGAFSDTVILAAKPVVTATGKFVFDIPFEDLGAATKIRVSSVPVGGPDTIGFWAYVAPIQGG